MFSSEQFGAYISTLRKEQGKTQYELAYLSDVQYSTLNTIEKGKSMPTAIVAINLLNYFGVSFGDLTSPEQDVIRNYHLNNITKMLEGLTNPKDFIFLRKTFMNYRARE